MLVSCVNQWMKEETLLENKVASNLLNTERKL